MRKLALAVLALSFLACSAEAKETSIVISGTCGLHVYQNPDDAPVVTATYFGCENSPNFIGTIGTIPAWGESITFSEAGKSPIAGMFVVQYPFVDGGWLKIYGTKNGRRPVYNGTYTYSIVSN